jgi:hypothetical protein
VAISKKGITDNFKVKIWWDTIIASFVKSKTSISDTIRLAFYPIKWKYWDEHNVLLSVRYKSQTNNKMWKCYLGKIWDEIEKSFRLFCCCYCCWLLQKLWTSKLPELDIHMKKLCIYLIKYLILFTQYLDRLLQKLTITLTFDG